MTTHTVIEIPFSKLKLAKMLLFCLLFLAAGLWLLIAWPQTSNELFNQPFVKIFAGVVSILMGALGTYYFFRKMFDSTPGLRISEAGIEIQAGMHHFGPIPWSDITRIYATRVQSGFFSRENFVLIGLADPEKYIAREAGTWKGRVMAANNQRFLSPVYISTSILKISHKDLIKTLEEALQTYKASE